MKDFELQIRIRNNRLKEMRERSGFTQKSLGEACGMSGGVVSGYESMRASPRNAKGLWLPTALKISEFFAVNPEEIWTPAIEDVIKTNATLKVDAEDLAQLPQGDSGSAYGQLAASGGEEIVAYVEVLDRLKASFTCLNERDQQIVQMHFGLDGSEPKTYAEVGEVLKISRPYAQTLCNRALHKLRVELGVTPESIAESREENLDRALDNARHALAHGELKEAKKKDEHRLQGLLNTLADELKRRWNEIENLELDSRVEERVISNFVKHGEINVHCSKIEERDEVFLALEAMAQEGKFRKIVTNSSFGMLYRYLPYVEWIDEF